MKANVPEKRDSLAGASDVEQGRAVGSCAGRWSMSTLKRLLALVLSAWLIVSYIVHMPEYGELTGTIDSLLNGSHDNECPQASALAPSSHTDILKELEQEYESRQFRLRAYESLGGAVRIPTEMFDDLKPPGQDPRWEIFGELHKYLETSFPRVHTTLHKTVVNHYALVYHWQGSDDSLKPLLLTAHQDVVPVEPGTVGTWKHPPFSGFYDGEWIWGRGSCDDKPGLVGSLTAVEKLLEKGFQPTRTVVLAYGIDEERSGISGATAIRDYLLSGYGENAFAALIDEGGGQQLGENVLVAMPAVAEKGSFNLRMEVAAPGGHSSVPPAHTSIGMLAALITELEAHPHEVDLHRDDTYYQQLQCLATHSPDFPPALAKLVKRSRHSDKALDKLLKELVRAVPQFKAIAGTTQAVDVISGGVKTNALPESAQVIVNHRIAGYSSVGALKSRLIGVIGPVAERFNLSVDAFGEHLTDGSAPSSGRVTLSDAFGTALEPAPITPTTGSPPWEFLSGVIRNVINTSTRDIYHEKTVVVAPTILLGNTDTKHYWKLTKHIFRYSHANVNDSYNGFHTVNEATRAEGYLEMIRFFTHVILTADETKLL